MEWLEFGDLHAPHARHALDFAAAPCVHVKYKEEAKVGIKMPRQVTNINNVLTRIRGHIERLQSTFDVKGLAELGQASPGRDIGQVDRQLQLLCGVADQWRERFGPVQTPLKVLAAEFAGRCPARRRLTSPQAVPPLSLFGAWRGFSFVYSLELFKDEWHLGQPSDFQNAYGIWLEAKSFYRVDRPDGQVPLPLFYIYNLLAFCDHNSKSWNIVSRIMRLMENPSTAPRADALLRKLNLPMDIWGLPTNDKYEISVRPSFEAELESLEAAAVEVQEESPHAASCAAGRRSAQARRRNIDLGFSYRDPGVRRFALNARAALRRGVNVR